MADFEQKCAGPRALIQKRQTVQTNILEKTMLSYIPAL